MKSIGIIGAMSEEIELYLKELVGLKKITIGSFDFYSGKLSEKKVIIVKSGVGKVNASICAQILIDRFKVFSIIFTGVAGAVNEKNLNLFDIVVSKDSVQHDIEASGLGFEKGVIPYTNLKFFEACPNLRALALSSGEKLNLKTQEGRILTGDQFISDTSKVKELEDLFQGDCVDMESAAVAQVCELNKVPHVIIRSISDKANNLAPDDFAKFVKIAARNSFILVKQMVADMELEKENKELLNLLKEKIRTVPNWPKPGIMFRDITTLIKDKEGFGAILDILTTRYEGEKIDYVVGIESRGFIIGSALAHRLGIGFIPIRKAGKLPAKTVSEEYQLEYGEDKIEIHEDAVLPGMNVLLVDDLIATGGTALASCRLLSKIKANILECCFLVDLPDLQGKNKLKLAGFEVFSLIEFEGE